MNPQKNLRVTFLSLLVLMLAMLNGEASELHGEPTSVAATNTADTSQLQNRVETLEAAFRTIALAFLSQKKRFVCSDQSNFRARPCSQINSITFDI